MQEEHAAHFGDWNRSSTGKLLKICRRFNEFQMFMTLAEDKACRTMADVGCAAGGFYRFFHEYGPHLQYRGFDLSPVAIEAAKQRYPKGDFKLFDGNLETNPEIKSDIVFCRDVVHHQTDSFNFLSRLYDVTEKYLLLRVRTREVGATVADPELSCQYTYGQWVPFIVFNTSELLDFCRSLSPRPRVITLRQHPVVLGGQTGRFLPKELYYEETGSAQTAVLIQKGDAGNNQDSVIDVQIAPEQLSRVTPYWARGLRKLARRWGL